MLKKGPLELVRYLGSGFYSCLFLAQKVMGQDEVQSSISLLSVM